MLKLKYILLSILLIGTFLNAQVLQTSNELGNLEIVTDTACAKKNAKSDAAAEEKAPQTQKVETINYSLRDCNGITSFPVTIRSNKRQGE